MKPFSIVVAFDEKRGIGKNNGIPWHLPADMKHFAELTRTARDASSRNAVIMGRKTWDSLPEKFRPLPGRLNIILTRRADFAVVPGVFHTETLGKALERAEHEGVDKVFVIGGGAVFEHAIESAQCEQLYVTEIQKNFDCDTFFPKISGAFKRANVSEAREENGILFQFVEYRRKI